MKKLFYFGCVVIAVILSFTAQTQDPSFSASTNPIPVQIGDAKLIELGKTRLAQMSSGNIDGFVADYADNVRYYWSGGDSLIGKEAVKAFFTERRMKLIKNITFSNDIWLPIEVNEGTQAMPGTWLLGWFRFSAEYRTNKKVDGWIHTAMHLNKEKKIDVVFQYMDQAPVQKALGIK